MKYKLHLDMNKSHVFWGDSKNWLKHIPKESVDVIYIDPPFFTGKVFEYNSSVINFETGRRQKPKELDWGNGYETRAYNDMNEQGINGYKDYMIERLRIAREKLKKTGSIFLHCDRRANYKLREALNEVFGENCFINEIIWCYKSGGGSEGKKEFTQKHDTIFFYSKTPFNKSNTRIYKFYPSKEEISYKGHNYSTGNKKVKLFYKDEKRLCVDENCKINGKHFHKVRSEVYTKTLFKDWWVDIGMLATSSQERMYGTQKPTLLIEKILDFTTDEGDVVLDFFGGGGTTAVACINKGRKFITGDISPVANMCMLDRLNKLDAKYEKHLMPATRIEWQADTISGLKFSRQICNLMGWEWTDGVNDGGIDGWALKKTLPVQIKNWKEGKLVGTKSIREFVGALKKENSKRGLFVAWKLSSNSKKLIRDYKEKGINIEFLKIDDILKPLILEKDRNYYNNLYNEAVKEKKQEKHTFHHIPEKIS